MLCRNFRNGILLFFERGKWESKVNLDFKYKRADEKSNEKVFLVDAVRYISARKTRSQSLKVAIGSCKITTTTRNKIVKIKIKTIARALFPNLQFQITSILCTYYETLWTEFRTMHNTLNQPARFLSWSHSFQHEKFRLRGIHAVLCPIERNALQNNCL